MTNTYTLTAVTARIPAHDIDNLNIDLFPRAVALNMWDGYDVTDCTVIGEYSDPDAALSGLAPRFSVSGSIVTVTDYAVTCDDDFVDAPDFPAGAELALPLGVCRWDGEHWVLPDGSYQTAALYRINPDAEGSEYDYSPAYPCLVRLHHLRTLAAELDTPLSDVLSRYHAASEDELTRFGDLPAYV